jgi:hypothetical protein
MEISIEFLRLVTDHLKVGLTILDQDNNIILMNRLAGIMLQENPRERIGSSILRCHPSEKETAVEKLIEDIQTGVKDNQEAFVNYRGRVMYEYITAIRDADGRYVGMIDELHDAADRAELMQRLGEWKELHVSGEGMMAPRTPENTTSIASRK